MAKTRNQKKGGNLLKLGLAVILAGVLIVILSAFVHLILWLGVAIIVIAAIVLLLQKA